MTRFVIRFFVGGSAVDDVIEAENLAGAARQAADKLTQPIININDANGNISRTLLPVEVSHFTIVTLPVFRSLIK